MTEEHRNHNETLSQAVQHLHEDGLTLAKATLAGEGDVGERHEEAMQLWAALKELRPRIDALPEVDRPFVSQLHSNAILDLMFVLTDGQAPRSLPLEHYAREVGK